ncbi:MAG: PAS domain-containing protein [Hyphomicrobiales bacterium]
MKHANTRMLYDYWNGLRGPRPAPLRSDLDPRELKDLLPQTFILQRDSDERYAFRLAGTDICRIFGRELRDENFLADWRKNERESLISLFQSITIDHTAAVLGVNACFGDDKSCLIEYLLLPLRLDGTKETRVLGCASFIEERPRFGQLTVTGQEIVSLRLVWPDNMPRFMATAGTASEPESGHTGLKAPHGAGERRGHLWVIEGGAS